MKRKILLFDASIIILLSAFAFVSFNNLPKTASHNSVKNQQIKVKEQIKANKDDYLTKDCYFFYDLMQNTCRAGDPEDINEVPESTKTEAIDIIRTNNGWGYTQLLIIYNCATGDTCAIYGEPGGVPLYYHTC